MTAESPSTDDRHDASRWERLRALFEAGCLLQSEDRTRFVARVLVEDAALGSELSILLAEHDRADTGKARRDLLATVGELTAVPSLSAGSRISRYEIRRELGRGGMGVVYLADRSDEQGSTAVAIKVLAPSGARPRFAREWAILATLEHPHIARFLDAGDTDEGAPYYVMEYVAGAIVTAYCDSAALSVSARLELFLEICGAVQFAHANLVLHRDIKPDNILVTSEGIPKLIDFGIAKPLDRNDATGTQQRFFSPLNAAPEQLKGDHLGITCDVYQLGTLLYELLCGEAIFDFRQLTPSQLEQHIRDIPPTAPSDVAARGTKQTARLRTHATPRALSATLAGDLDNIVLQALRKAPHERYPSVARFAEDIEAYLSRRPVSARRGHAWYRVRRFVSRHRIGVGAMTLALLTAGALIAALAIQARDLQLQRDAARHDRDRADTTAHLLVDIFKTADPGMALTRDMRIGDVLESAQRGLTRRVDLSSDIRAELLAALADVHLSLSDHRAALRLLDQGAAALDKSGMQQTRAMATVLETRARVEGAAGNTRVAYVLAGKALDLHERLGDPPAARLMARHTRVRAMEDFATVSESIEAYRSLYANMLEADADALPLARIEIQLAQLLLSERDPMACDLAAKALARLRSALPQRHPDLLWARAANAACHDEVDRVADPDVLAALEATYAEQVDLLGSRSFIPTATLAWIASAFHRRGAHMAAIAAATEVERTFADLHDHPQFDSFSSLANLGDYELAGGRFAEATAHLEEAATMARAIWGEYGPKIPEVDGRLGVAYARQGRLEEAESVLRRATERSRTDWPRTAWIALELANVQTRLGHVADSRETLASLDLILTTAAARFPELKPRQVALREHLDALGPSR
jgi:serine/threonine-protein kinase